MRIAMLPFCPLLAAVAFAAALIVPAEAPAQPSGAAAAGFTIPAPQNRPYLGPIRLQVDATDLDHRIFQVRQLMPAKAGRLTLLYPKFLPGTHGPYGTIDRVAGLRVRLGAQEIPWVRDTVEGHAFHLEVPAATSELEISFQLLTPLSPSGGRVLMTREMLNLQWISTVMYPAGHHIRALTVHPEVVLPSGWTQASALRVESQAAGRVRFAPVNLETLADSPIFAGRYSRRVELDLPDHARPVALNLFADEPQELQFSDGQLQAHRNLVQQADKLFASRHFGRYEFLLAISDRLGGIGLEHHESSENGVKPGYFKDWGKRAGSRTLLPHEYAHSWNGKFRRPADLLTPNFNVPMQDSLLWLYEGQTDYWGRVLAVRSGLVSAEQARDSLAEVAATHAHRAGRVWRNLQDTTNEPMLGSRRADLDWPNWQRSADYYSEAALVWLDADTLIREKTQGERSLDDFARSFFGVKDGRIEPLAYTFDDIVAALNAVLPWDWKTFLRQRLDSNDPAAPLDGLKRAGWQLTWAEKPSDVNTPDDPDARNDDFSYSVGLSLKRDGKIDRVMWGSPAFQAGMSRALQVVAVNAMAYKGERLAAAISANRAGEAPVDLLVREGDAFRHITLDYRGGLRYPRLTRISSDAPERLDAGVFKPRS